MHGYYHIFTPINPIVYFDVNVTVLFASVTYFLPMLLLTCLKVVNFLKLTSYIYDHNVSLSKHHYLFNNKNKCA